MITARTVGVAAVYKDCHHLACVASVSVGLESKKTMEQLFARVKLGDSQNKKEGVGEGMEGNAYRQTPANGARDWLDQSNVIDMCRS